MVVCTFLVGENVGASIFPGFHSVSIIMLSSYLFPSLAAIAVVSAHPLNGAGSGTAVASVGSNFPDPSIIQVDNTWYSFATNGSGVNIQFASTKNVQGSWTFKTGYDALPILPAWASTTIPDVWAPDVVQIVRSPVSLTPFSPSINKMNRAPVSSCTSPPDRLQMTQFTA